VKAKKAITADALSTGFFVMGASKSIELAEKLKNVDVICVKKIDQNGKPVVRFTEGFMQNRKN
jgi:thiamine biosynthesis lipoprotein ApbE